MSVSLNVTLPAPALQRQSTRADRKGRLSSLAGCTGQIDGRSLAWLGSPGCWLQPDLRAAQYGKHRLGAVSAVQHRTGKACLSDYSTVCLLHLPFKFCMVHLSFPGVLTGGLQQDGGAAAALLSCSQCARLGRCD